jgi:hypothetical protein
MFGSVVFEVVFVVTFATQSLGGRCRGSYPPDDAETNHCSVCILVSDECWALALGDVRAWRCWHCNERRPWCKRVR